MTNAVNHGSRVIIVCDWFPPATKSGGPARSLASIVRAESRDHTIWVLTSDRDLGDVTPYSEDQVRKSAQTGAMRVLRVRRGALSLLSQLCGTVRRNDLLYLNSVFSPFFSIWPMILRNFRILPRGPVLLAPRGELASAALEIKPHKKRVASWLMRNLVRHSQVVWHASSEREAIDIERFMRSPNVPIIVQADPGPRPQSTTPTPKMQPLTIAFVGRMVPIKNFDQIIKAAKLFDARLDVLVVGQLENLDYWERCRRELVALSVAVNVKLLGHLPDEDVASVIRQSDAMVLPTRGENFGHAIAEALSLGCPVMVPDTTMWTSTVEAGGGWIIDTDDPKKLVAGLRDLDGMSAAQRMTHRRGVLDVYQSWWSTEQRDRTSLFDVAVRLQADCRLPG